MTRLPAAQRYGSWNLVCSRFRKWMMGLAAADAYGCPVYIMLSGGRRNDIHYAVPMLEHINIEGRRILADRGYDSRRLIDYIYINGREPTVRPKKEPDLSAAATGGCIKSAIWLKNIFSNGKVSAVLLSVMISWHLHIWDSYALHQS